MNDFDPNVSERLKQVAKDAINSNEPEPPYPQDVLTVISCMLVGCGLLNHRDFVTCKSRQAKAEALYIAIAKLIAKGSNNY